MLNKAHMKFVFIGAGSSVFTMRLVGDVPRSTVRQLRLSGGAAAGSHPGESGRSARKVEGTVTPDGEIKTKPRSIPRHFQKRF